MATKLLRTVKRELLAKDARGRTLIVRMEPGDLISFSVKGKRTRYEISLHSANTLAVAQFIQSKYNAQMEDYKAKRRSRKPRQPNFSTFHRSIQVAMRK